MVNKTKNSHSERVAGLTLPLSYAMTLLHVYFFVKYYKCMTLNSVKRMAY